MKFMHFDFLIAKFSSFQDIKNKKRIKNKQVRKSEFISN